MTKNKKYNLWNTYLKVSPKGQVTFPKKLREAIDVKDLMAVEIRDRKAIVKKPESVTEDLAGCFRKYSLKKKITVEEAIKKSSGIVAHEIEDLPVVTGVF